jgi:hypothetical protein
MWARTHVGTIGNLLDRKPWMGVALRGIVLVAAGKGCYAALVLSAAGGLLTFKLTFWELSVQKRTKDSLISGLYAFDLVCCSS